MKKLLLTVGLLMFGHVCFGYDQATLDYVKANKKCPDDKSGSLCDLSGATFTQVDLSSRNLSGADFTKAQFIAQDAFAEGGPSGERENTYGVNFKNATLSGVKFNKAVFKAGRAFAFCTSAAVHEGGRPIGCSGNPTSYGADFENADLTGADFSGAQFSRAGTTGAGESWGANFTNAKWLNLKGVTQLVGVNLSGVDLAGQDLSGKVLTDANLSGAKGVNLKGVTQLVGVNLSGVNLAGQDLSGKDLTNVNLPGAKGVNLKGVTQLVGINLSGVDLAGQDLSGKDLTNVNLTDANLSGANLTNAFGLDLTGVKQLAGVNLTNVNFRGFWWPHIKKFEHVDFTGAILNGVNFDGSSFKNTNLTKVKGLNLHGVLELQSANLTNVDLTGQDLTDRNFTNANLTNVNFTNAKIDDKTTTLTGADVTGAIGLFKPDDSASVYNFLVNKKVTMSCGNVHSYTNFNEETQKEETQYIFSKAVEIKTKEDRNKRNTCNYMPGGSYKSAPKSNIGTNSCSVKEGLLDCGVKNKLDLSPIKANGRYCRDKKGWGWWHIGLNAGYLQCEAVEQ